MTLKFKEPYGDEEQGYKKDHEYKFVDTRKAHYFVDHGIAMFVDDDNQMIQKKGKKDGKHLDAIDTK